jgi:hypothetical protein
MIIDTPISLGELIDKISILQIKSLKIKGVKKQKLINNELKLLGATLVKVLGEEKKIKKYLNKLYIVNSKLWEVEDKIRECERQKKFDKGFIDLARKIYITNDKRAKIKLEVNQKFGSQIIEVKSYKKY